MKDVIAADAHFAEFIEQHTDSLLTTAYLLTRDRVAAEELVQDVLVAMYPQWRRVLAADSALAYVRRSLVNRFLNQRRRRAGSELSLTSLPELGDRPDFTAGVADRDQLRRVLAGLPERQRAAVVLRYFYDYSDQQIADALQCRIGTARSLISRALAELRAAASDTPSGTGGMLR
ncbi:MAG TPA: SigE family RNA polymerase sigma factor [Jatrophihabitans sp.]|nr:SigE family RNA polymerase sigma factor [Jatrophihabitans sp.]